MRWTMAVMVSVSIGVAFWLRAAHAAEESLRDATAANAAIDGWWAASQKNLDQRLQWWREARFGCFIHWGAYAVPAGEWNGRAGGSYSEHIMRWAKIPLPVYKEKVVGAFDPEEFDADQWVKLIKGAGMKYVIITAKHHDGFAMWPCDCYKYDIRDNTKFKRDPMAELSAACRKNGIRFGFYYSHAFDWEHPDGSGNDWDYDNPGGDKKLFGGEHWYDLHPELVARTEIYVQQKAIPQLQELIRKYQPDILWFDTPGKLPLSQLLEILAAVRQASPTVVINGRAARDATHNFGDYLDTADNPAEIRAQPGDWECIPTVNHSYGFSKVDHDYKTPAFLIRLLVKTAAKGGNMLLNIGPTGDGEIDPNATAILQGIGKWTAVNGASIYGTTRTPLDRQAWGDTTVKGNTMYLHVFDWPSDGKLVVGGLTCDPVKTYLLSDPNQSPLATASLQNDLLVHLPASAPDAVDSVIVVETKDGIHATPGRLLASNVPTNRLLAFDGILSGSRFIYGDGKAGRDYVSGFGRPSNSISWPCRINEPGRFDVSITHGDAKAAQFVLDIGSKSMPGQLTGAAALQTQELGPIDLSPGDISVRFHADEEVKLFEINLKPIPAALR